jgi:hypothetical protein
MNGNNKKDLRAFVRYDGSGRVVAGSLILRRQKPKVGKWTEVQGYECCTDHTLTTTVATAITNFKVRMYCGGSIGSELLSSTGWTAGTGWSGSFAAGYAHTTGTAALSNSLAAVVGKQYTISITITGASAGSISVAFGGVTTSAIAASTILNVLATGVGNLVITPLTAFNGTVIVSIKQSNSLVLTLASSQSSTTVADLVTRLNTTYPVLGVFSTTGGTNLTLVMTDLQKQAICSGQQALTMTVSI